MSVTHDEVHRIARLAELDVSEQALPLDGFFLVPKLGQFEDAGA